MVLWGKIERLVYMKDFKKWWRETHNRKDVGVIHATQRSLNEYMRAHPHHQIIKDVVFEENITLTGNHERLDIERVCFLGGLEIKDFSSFHDLSFRDIVIAEKFLAEKVSLTRNLLLNQDVGEILTAGLKMQICDCHIKGKLIFQK